jgi:hypothetical protein
MQSVVVADAQVAGGGDKPTGFGRDADALGR